MGLFSLGLVQRLVRDNERSLYVCRGHFLCKLCLGTWCVWFGVFVSLLVGWFSHDDLTFVGWRFLMGARRAVLSSCLGRVGLSSLLFVNWCPVSLGCHDE